MLYKIMLFLHVTGALMLSAAIAIEWLCMINLQKAHTLESIGKSIANYSLLSKIGPAAMALILIPGIYMAAVAWGGTAWITTGFAGLILLGAIGGILSGRKMYTIGKKIGNEKHLSPELEQLSSDRWMLFSIKIRTTILLGIIFLMTNRPGLAGSLLTLAVSIVIGLIPLRIKSNSMREQMQDAGR